MGLFPRERKRDKEVEGNGIMPTQEEEKNNGVLPSVIDVSDTGGARHGEGLSNEDDIGDILRGIQKSINI